MCELEVSRVSYQLDHLSWWSLGWTNVYIIVYISIGYYLPTSPQECLQDKCHSHYESTLIPLESSDLEMQRLSANEMG